MYMDVWFYNIEVNISYGSNLEGNRSIPTTKFKTFI